MAPTASMESGRSWPMAKMWMGGRAESDVLRVSRRLSQCAVVFVNPASSAALDSPDQILPATLRASGLS